jgi:hypothetical protein
MKDTTMAIITQETRIALAKHEALNLGRLRRRRLECLRGEVWLTIDGEGCDIILRPGQAHAIGSDTEVVISAFAPSVLALRSAAQASVRGSLASMLASLLSRVLAVPFPTSTTP